MVGRKPSISSEGDSLFHVGLPQIDCPKCQIRVVKRKSKQADSFGKVFYKCPNNFPGDITCRYFWWEDEYVSYLHAKHADLLDNHEAISTPQFMDSSMSKQVTDSAKNDLKMEMCDFKMRVYELKLVIAEMKGEMNQLKHEIGKGKSGFALDNAIVGVLAVGIMLGILVAVVWNK